MEYSNETRSAAIERLKVEREANPLPPPKVPRSLPLDALHVEPAVFQPREIGLDQERVKEISEGLNGGALDERVHIWWSGKRWIVIDGHHRHAAYMLLRETSGETLKVPVEAHPQFSLGEAMGAAAKINSRDRVRITREEKGNNAWRLVCLGEGSIAEQAEWSGASKAQISIMRKTFESLRERRIKAPTMIDRGWDWSRQIAKGDSPREFTEEVQEGMAQDWAKKIGNALGGKATECPGVLARALQIISPTLPARLLDSEAFWDALNETGREILADADQYRKDEEVTFEAEEEEDF
ncbi:hypothetical protein [Celeribacter sp. ULVN23_4]